MKWTLNARSSWEPREAMQPGQFLLAECAVNQRETMQRVVLSLLNGAHPENIPSVAIAEAEKKQKEQQTQGACLIGCIAVGALLFLVFIISLMSSK
jgi:hypothetical protein